MTFKEKLIEDEVNEAQVQLQAWLFLMEQDLDMLNEADLNEGLNKHLSRVGLKLHKGKGILDYIKSFTKGAGKVLFYAIKGDKEKAQKILDTLKKEDFLDFIYKLDLGTLHLITGPLHMIDAWTGWDLSVNLASHMKKAESMVDIFVSAISQVKNAVTNMFSGDKQKIMLNHLHRLEAGVA